MNERSIRSYITRTENSILKERYSLLKQDIDRIAAEAEIPKWLARRYLFARTIADMLETPVFDKEEEAQFREIT